MPTTGERAERICFLRAKIEEIRKRLPKHSVSAAMMVELDDLEYELRNLLTESEAERPEASDQKGGGEA